MNDRRCQVVFFGYLALALGIAFEIVGLVSLFTTPVLTLVVLGFQVLWVIAAAITLIVRAGTAADTTVEVSLRS